MQFFTWVARSCFPLRTKVYQICYSVHQLLIIGFVVLKKILLTSALCLTLAACESSEERAERHYQNALTLMAQGDEARAMIELRNVFDLDGSHREARKLYAKTAREQGDFRDAMGQYLRLVEQYPDDIEGSRALAEMSLQGQDLATARKYLDVAIAATPQDPELLAMDSFMDYVRARQDNDAAARDEAIKAASAVLREDGTQLYARQVLIQNYIDIQDWSQALSALEVSLGQTPDRLDLYRLKLGVLSAYQDNDAIDATLQEMARRFPEDKTVDQLLVGWYVQNDRLDGAEDWLRQQIDPESSSPAARLRLLQFLSSLRGSQIALTELEQLLESPQVPGDVAQNQIQFDSLRASLMFVLQQREAGIAYLEGVLAEAPLDIENNRARVSLARMYESTGNNVGARQLVETVLDSDEGQTEARKMKAAWLIEDDQTGDAIVLLRDALGQAPRDAQIMTLLARAHEREGSRSLMGEMLSLAVEASQQAPRESLVFARYLMADGQFRSAENILVESLRLNNTNVQLLVALGQVHIELEDWSRVEQDVARLRSLSQSDNPRQAQAAAQAKEAASRMQATLLLRQQKTDALMEFLANNSEDGSQSDATIIRANLLAGRYEEAFALARSHAQKNPDDLAAQFVYAVTLDFNNQSDEAAEVLRALLQAEPKAIEPWIALYRLERRTAAQSGNSAEALDVARDVLLKARDVIPGSPQLQLLLAGDYEQRGESDKALAIYELMYDNNSENLIVANNYASLLTTLRDDDESLQRAFTVARRLRGLEQPAFQDTYGWIAFRRGELDSALNHLRKAAQGLPNDPSVQFHLGRVYEAQGNVTQARSQYERAIILIDQGGAQYNALRPDIETALAGLS